MTSAAVANGSPVSRLRAGAGRAWKRARRQLRQTLLFAVVGFGVAFAVNILIMGGVYDGFRTPAGTPATGTGNTLQGSLFYLVASTLIAAVISYRIAAGPERFSRDVRALPHDIRAALTEDGRLTLVHVLFGAAAALVAVAVVGPSVSAVLAIAAVLAFTPILRPFVSELVGFVVRALLGRVSPARTAVPQTVAILVGVIGSAVGFAIGWQLPASPQVPLVIAVVAFVLAVIIGRRGSGGTPPTGMPPAGTPPGGEQKTASAEPPASTVPPVPPVAVILAIATGTFALLLADPSLVLADDGGFKECGNPSVARWLTACAGSAGVLGNSVLGAVISAIGAATGAAIGAELGGSETGTTDGTGTGPGTEEQPGEGQPIPPPPPVSGPNPFCLDKIDIEDIDWGLMPDEIRERIRQQLIHDWRSHNLGADYIRMQQAGQEIDAMLSGDGPVKQWMKDGWQFLKDSAELTWDDFKNGNALNSISGATQGIIDGLKSGAIGLKDMVVNAPAMVGTALQFWTSQDPVTSVQRIVAEVPGMTSEMAGQFLDMVQEIQQASLSGDNTRVGQILGKLAGQADFEILLGMGTEQALKTGSQLLKDARLTRSIEAAAEEMPGATKTGQLVENPGPIRRPAGEEVTVSQLENDFGYDSFTADFLDAKAKEHGVLIEMKPANPESLEMIKSGEALAKPEWLKAKTANSLDIELGAPAGSEGKVAFFEPRKPLNYDTLAADDPLRIRYDDRAAQWESYSHDMAELQKPPSQRTPEFQNAIRRQYGQDLPLEIEIRDGLVFDKHTGKPFTGDYDLWAMRDAKTGQLLDPARAQQIYEDMGMTFNPQHGPGTAHWEPPTPKLENVKQRLYNDHSTCNPNGTNLLQFGGSESGLPTTTWAK